MTQRVNFSTITRTFFNSLDRINIGLKTVPGRLTRRLISKKIALADLRPRLFTYERIGAEVTHVRQ